ncbi:MULTISPECIES: toxin YdaT family protein [Providencia]|uniref:tRNA-(Guanine-N1)-methyltransferase n=1 Tax=Providencia manganoxydans TaxID=2923283 RepID=A0ABX7AI75_9GAMM|nr:MULTISPECIES: toxin YdaT family protein [unclassified Providencia]MCL0018987.1 toxin YdaT domain-containing protein [Providencia rettgeri]QQO63671.1 tRNA-(guanine-N1)-methyltransferase [Providencia manganoxydans]
MSFDIDIVRSEIESWATEHGQEHVAIEISRAYLQITRDKSQSRLHVIEDERGQADWKAINNNRQQIFRWLRGDSPASIRKIVELMPAIEIALPASRLARVRGDTKNYLASIAIQRFAEAISEILLEGRDMSHHINNAVIALNAIPRQTSVH